MKHLFLFVLFLSLLSCSRVDLIYDFAPKVMTDKLDDAFDFNSVRYKEIREQIKKNLAEQKPTVVKNLTDFIGQVLIVSDKDKLSPEEIRTLLDEGRSKEKSTVALFRPTFEKVILQLNEAEISDFQTFSADKMREAKDLMADQEKFVQKKIKDFNTVMDFFFDDAEDAQEALYAEYVRDNSQFYILQAEDRADLVARLTWPIADHQKVTEHVLKYYTLDPSVRSAAYNEQLKSFETKLVQFQSKLWSTLTPSQKSYFKKRLTDLRADLFKLLSSE